MQYLDSEASAVEIGDYSIICENAVIRATKVEDIDHPVDIGDHAFISPHATLSMILFWNLEEKYHDR
ncbi:MAG: hypothetical protein PVH74_07935 [Desulfobacterales bacterium]|nr:hypothetical protein [Deltaproteobacteria bacterium]